jgi:glycerol uptake facilitator-like aquaporin
VPRFPDGCVTFLHGAAGVPERVSSRLHAHAPVLVRLSRVAAPRCSALPTGAPLVRLMFRSPPPPPPTPPTPAEGIGWVIVAAVVAALLAKCSGAASDAKALMEFRTEFLGTAIVVALTCSPGIWWGYGLVPGTSLPTDWLFHAAGIILTDWACGGPHVNPGVSFNNYLRGSMDLVEFLARTAGQVLGATLGFCGSNALAAGLGWPLINFPSVSPTLAGPALATACTHEVLAMVALTLFLCKSRQSRTTPTDSYRAEGAAFIVLSLSLSLSLSFALSLFLFGPRPHRREPTVRPNIRRQAAAHRLVRARHHPHVQRCGAVAQSGARDGVATLHALGAARYGRSLLARLLAELAGRSPPRHHRLCALRRLHPVWRAAAQAEGRVMPRRKLGRAVESCPRRSRTCLQQWSMRCDRESLVPGVRPACAAGGATLYGV